MAEKTSFLVHLENMVQFDMLNDEQLGKLFRAMCNFSKTKEEPDFSDPLLAMLFSVVRANMIRDESKYEETCRKRSENGKKGGRPKKANGFLAFSEKAKKADSDSVCMCDSVCDSDSESDYDSVCECDSVSAQDNTTHTAHTETAIEKFSVKEILDLSKSLGYSWDVQEAQKFLSYNMDKGRTRNWGFAATKWEENRKKREQQRIHKGKGKQIMTEQEIEEMNDYLSLSNRFREDEANG